MLAGTELETRIVATAGTSGTTGCKDLKVDGVAKWTGPVSFDGGACNDFRVDHICHSGRSYRGKCNIFRYYGTLLSGEVC